MSNQNSLSGYILAGGKSSRMGTDKALLLVEYETMMERMINLVKPFCSSLAISGSKPEYADFKLKMIPDIYPDCGPISGIYSSLKHTNTEWNLLVGVDVPFINEELLTFLISNIADFDCIVPKHTHGIEPMIALYNKSSLVEIEESLKNGDFKLMNVFSRLNARYVDCNSLIKKYPRLFMNMNRLEDYLSM